MLSLVIIRLNANATDIFLPILLISGFTDGTTRIFPRLFLSLSEQVTVSLRIIPV